MISPNPNSGKFQLSFELPYKDIITISVYDQSGKMIQVFQQAILLEKGLHHLFMNLNKVEPGKYFIAIDGNKTNQTQQLLIIAP